jgi:anti-sigma B factor antagonist
MGDPLVVDVDHEDEGRTVRVRPRGDIDLATVAVLQACLRSLPAAAEVVVDLADVAFIDSSGINAVLRANLDREGHGGRVRVAHPRPSTRRALEALDLLDLVDPEPRHELAADAGEA